MSPKVFYFHAHAPDAWKMPDRRAVDIICAAPSRKAVVAAAEAAGLHGITVGFLATYGSTTGNVADIESATAYPGRILYRADLDRSQSYHVAPIR